MFHTVVVNFTDPEEKHEFEAHVEFYAGKSAREPWNEEEAEIGEIEELYMLSAHNRRQIEPTPQIIEWLYRAIDNAFDDMCQQWQDQNDCIEAEYRGERYGY